MFNISSFLEKVSKNIKNNEISKDKIINIIENKAGIKLNKEKVEIKDFIVYTKEGGAVLNKIFINKTNIIEEIKNSLNVNIKDIK